MWGDLPDGVIVQGSGHLGGVVVQGEWSSGGSGDPGGVVIQMEWLSM